MIPVRLAMIGSAFSFSAALLQLAPGASNAVGIDVVRQVESVGLTGALLIAVTILYKSKERRDEAMLQSLQAMTKALADSASNAAELRRCIEAKLSCTCATHTPQVPEE